MSLIRLWLKLKLVITKSTNYLFVVVPIVYILLYWQTMFPWGAIEGNTFLNILGWAHISASISPWIGSVIYHLFMSYNQGGDRFYQLLLQIDMFGIWVTECFGITRSKSICIVFHLVMRKLCGHLMTVSLLGALSNLTAAAWCLPKDYQTAMMTVKKYVTIKLMHFF